MVEKATLDRVEKLPNGRNIIRGGGYFSGKEMIDMVTQSARNRDGLINIKLPFEADRFECTKNQATVDAALGLKNGVKPGVSKKKPKKVQEMPKEAQEELDKAKQDMDKLLEKYNVDRV